MGEGAPLARGALLAVLLVCSAWQGVAPSAHADPLVPPPTTGTATGSYRTGLAKAGLVQFTALGQARVWLALKTANDKSSAFDVRVELLNNGTPIATGLTRCLSDFTTAPREVLVPWGTFTPPTLQVGDVLGLRVSTRIGTKSNGTKCKGSDQAAGLRLSYDATNRASRFAATITPNPQIDISLHSTGGTGCNPATLQLSDIAPTGTTANCKDSGVVDYPSGNAWAAFGTWNLDAQCDCANQFIPEVRNSPPAPAPEPVTVDELPLPPTAPSTTAGSCTTAVNPNGTGCISAADTAIQEGPAYMWDGHHVLLTIVFAGAPAAPDPSSVFTGTQVIVIKADGKLFSNGDAWKCLTCGVPAANAAGRNSALDHLEAFHDGKRALIGTNILDCSPHLITDDACTPAATHIYPIRWNVTADGSGAGGSMRELRLNPDDVHLGWSRLILGQPGSTSSPTWGIWSSTRPPTGTPTVPRYELDPVTQLGNDRPEDQPFRLDPDHPGEILFDPLGTPGTGEVRGFTSDGKEVIGIGYPAESNHIDTFATSLTADTKRRLARTEYNDPIKMSPDDNWYVDLDVHVAGRSMFIGGMDGIPAINDLMTPAAVSGVRNNGNRRFFRPMLVDRYGHRGSYIGQQLNAGGDGSPGSVNDPNWNGRADPAWDPDGTNVVYWQALVTSPACGGANPVGDHRKSRSAIIESRVAGSAFLAV